MEQSKKKYLAPVGALLLALLLVTVITFPMLSMEVKDIPVAVFSQDEGMKTPGGTVNAGENMVKQITKSGNKALDWDVLKSNQEVQDALDDGTYYAVFTIPKDFTKTAAAGGENALKVTLDQGKNPLVSNSLTGMLTAMSEKSGMKLQTEIIHSTADYGMLAMFLPMACIMFLYIGSLLTSLMTTKNVGLQYGAAKGGVGASYGIQLLYLICGALVLGFAAVCIIRGITGVELEIGKIGIMLAIIAGGIMLLTNGCINLFGTKGIAIPVLLFFLGMSLMSIPHQFLPGFWDAVVASWEPLRYFGEGLRALLYQGSGLWNCATVASIVLAAVGVAVSLIAVVREKKYWETAGENQ